MGGRRPDRPGPTIETVLTEGVLSRAESAHARAGGQRNPAPAAVATDAQWQTAKKPGDGILQRARLKTAVGEDAGALTACKSS